MIVFLLILWFIPFSGNDIPHDLSQKKTVMTVYL